MGWYYIFSLSNFIDFALAGALDFCSWISSVESNIVLCSYTGINVKFCCPAHCKMVIFLIILVKTQFELDATIFHCSINALCRIFKIHLRHTSLLLWWHFNIQKHDFKRNEQWSVVWHVSQTPHGRALANKHYHRVLVISWVSDFFFPLQNDCL